MKPDIVVFKAATIEQLIKRLSIKPINDYAGAWYAPAGLRKWTISGRIQSKYPNISNFPRSREKNKEV